MYTYGYIRQAVMAHIDLDESEALVMDLLARFHIFANEAMQAICAVKPKYKYLNVEILKDFDIVIRAYNDDDEVYYRLPTNDERYYLANGHWPAGHIPSDEPAPDVADEIATKEFYHAQHKYKVNEVIKLEADFIAFAENQAYMIKEPIDFNKELFVKGIKPEKPTTIKEPIQSGDKTFDYINNDSIIFHTVGKYLVPYKAVWYNFVSNLADDTNLDMPTDVLVCIPLYIAAEALQIDYAQKAQLKRQEFEYALARVTVTNKIPTSKIMPSF